jgi:predicted N-acetyltransferase YhbS
MKLVRWRRFTWELSKLPAVEKPLPDHYHVRSALRDEEKVVSNVIMSAFSLDSAWSDTVKNFRERLETQLETAFARESVPSLVICHGQRIIGASALSTEVDAENHLLSGPCVLMEYRNRGLGTSLLYFSLKQLQQSGLARVHGVVKENVVACKFIYPKFESSNSSYNYEPALAGT